MRHIDWNDGICKGHGVILHKTSCAGFATSGLLSLGGQIKFLHSKSLHQLVCRCVSSYNVSCHDAVNFSEGFFLLLSQFPKACYSSNHSYIALWRFFRSLQGCMLNFKTLWSGITYLHRHHSLNMQSQLLPVV